MYHMPMLWGINLVRQVEWKIKNLLSRDRLKGGVMGKLPVIGKWKYIGLVAVATVALFALACGGAPEETTPTAPNLSLIHI